MTRDKARKSAARNLKVQTGRPYVLSRRESAPTPDSTILCSDLSARIDRHLSRLGWTDAGNQTRSPSLGDMESWDWFPGPAHVLVGRDRGWFDGSGDPDDPDDYDISQVPTVTLMFPPIQSNFDPGFTDAEIAGNQAAEQIAATIRDLVDAGRRRGLEALRIDAECTICGSQYDARHLFPMDHYRLCPTCVYDMDVGPTLHPAEFMCFYDQLWMSDSAMPNALAPLAVLFATLCHHAGPDTAEKVFKDVGARDFMVPLEHWADPADIWIWIPHGVALPDALEMYRPGARLGTILDALKGHNPQLRAAIVADMAADREVPLTATELEALKDATWFWWPLMVSLALCLELPGRHAPADAAQTEDWCDQVCDSQHTDAVFGCFDMEHANDRWFRTAVGGIRHLGTRLAPVSEHGEPD